MCLATLFQKVAAYLRQVVSSSNDPLLDLKQIKEAANGQDSRTKKFGKEAKRTQPNEARRKKTKHSGQ